MVSRIRQVVLCQALVCLEAAPSHDNTLIGLLQDFLPD